ncbi:anthranilate synthase component I family protein [Microbacterium aurantiacum]|uniref:anthranilate synthase component I family protein n=1 Tax=Microbacterium aurantiacum TaxID=162393 RepID=UPI000C7F91F0|nr:anthranilate synthase component I family protein [Microbacterium aurantiacum]
MSDRLSSRVLPGWTDPAALFEALESVSPDVFWLDAGTDAREGWSFIGTGERAGEPDAVRVDTDQGDAGAPPFRGGWVGWCDYESGAAAAGAPSAPAIGRSWLRVRRVVAFDHESDRVWALADEADLDEWTAFVEEPRAVSAGAAVSGKGLLAKARHEPAEYMRLIERCRELIRAGIAYQLCLTTRFTVPGRHDAVAAYLRLRAATPAHHGGFVRIGGRALLSASPEQFLHAADGVIRTRPIKGTRPRSADPGEDAALAAELAVNVKERAENVMIVDLMRNDLSRVCEPGSIRVDGLWQVESYPAVHQLVSTVSGTASPGTTVGDLLEATFPAGSMTGAPKLSAMTRLHELEGGQRGIYAGCFGYVGVDGSLDLAMVIRSIVVEQSEAVVGAGGGITWGSVPAAEVAEVATKARAPLAALGAVLPEHWGSDILN